MSPRASQHPFDAGAAEPAAPVTPRLRGISASLAEHVPEKYTNMTPAILPRIAHIACRWWTAASRLRPTRPLPGPSRRRRRRQGRQRQGPRQRGRYGQRPARVMSWPPVRVKRRWGRCRWRGHSAPMRRWRPSPLPRLRPLRRRLKLLLKHLPPLLQAKVVAAKSLSADLPVAPRGAMYAKRQSGGEAVTPTPPVDDWHVLIFSTAAALHLTCVLWLARGNNYNRMHHAATLARNWS